MLRNQKGFSPIIVIVGIIVVLIGLLIYMQISSKANISSKQSVGFSDFEKIDSPDYVFYYPKGYIEGGLYQGDMLAYNNPKTEVAEAESIHLSKQSSARNLSRPSYQFCAQMAENYRAKKDDEIKAEVAFGVSDGSGGVGCKIVAKSKVSDQINDSAVVVERTLWHDTGSDTNIYTAKAVYFAVASTDQAERLDLAVDQFSLK